MHTGKVVKIAEYFYIATSKIVFTKEQQKAIKLPFLSYTPNQISEKQKLFPVETQNPVNLL
jgi:hypothetical protein